ncbi:hypothetical protein Tco_1305232 [Tanacetum coccineum]
MDNSILNNKEWKESDYRNPLNTATDSFFKAHDEHDIEEGNELRQMKHKEDNRNDEQPNKRVCKAEKFNAIKYSQGPNEEYIAIKRNKYNAWERNEEVCPKSTKKFFRKRTTDGRSPYGVFQFMDTVTSLEKKSMKLVNYQSSGILCVL